MWKILILIILIVFVGYFFLGGSIMQSNIKNLKAVSLFSEYSQSTTASITTTAPPWTTNLEKGADFKAVNYATDFQDGYFALYYNNAGTWEIIPDIWLNGNKFGANISKIQKDSEFKYIFQSSQPLQKETEYRYYFSKTINKKFGSISGTAEERYYFDFSDICNLKIDETLKDEELSKQILFNPNCKISFVDKNTIQILFMGQYDSKLGYIFIDPSISVGQVNQTAGIKSNVVCEDYPLCHIAINDSKLILYMPFDVNHTAKYNVTYDYSGQNNDGVVWGLPPYLSSGIIGGTYRFFGTNGYNIRLSQPSSLNLTSNFTISVWVNTFISSGTQYIMRAGGDSAGTQYQIWNLLRDNNRYVLFQIRNSSSNRNELTAGRLNVGNWTHIACGINESNYLSCYFNGVLTNSTLKTISGASELTGGLVALIGDAKTTGTSAFNGTIDEVMVFNRSLDASEILNIFNNQSYRYITPATQEFANVSISQDGSLNKVNVSTNSTLLFGTNISLRLREYGVGNVPIENTSWTNLTSGDNQVKTFAISTSAYNLTLEFNYLPESTYNFYSPVLSDNVDVVSFSLDDTRPNLTFNYQQPSDLNLTNFIGAGGMNITYNISDDIKLNLSTIVINYKSNSTSSNIMYYQNGTAHQGFFSKNYSNNVSDVFRWNFLDNEILPGTYNFGEVTLENTPHSLNTLTTQSQYASVELLNVSNSTRYGFYEIMGNSTLIQRIYYCNSSYGFSNSPETNKNCLLFYTIPANTDYNHIHTNFSRHQVIPFAINITTGKVGTIDVTEKSYFMLRGTNGGTVNFFSISNLSRTNAMKITINNGVAWTSQTYTIDAHLHQFGTGSSIWYYACANDTNANQNCSSLRQDLLETIGLPPSVFIYSPTSKTYTTNISVNYSAFSPSGYSIVNYTVDLFDASLNFNHTIRSNTTNTSIIFNVTGYDGTWIIRVGATDNVSQVGYGYSPEFTINTVTPEAVAAATETCKYKKLEYYNLHLPWLRQTNCV